MRRIAALQGLRAVAVVAVVIYHAWPSILPGGYLGVDVFFVLSGYLITRLLQQELGRSGRIDLLEFYARRTRRLAPALLTMAVAVTLIAYAYYSPLEQRGLTSSLLASLTYLSNLWFASGATDYFGAAHDDPLLHTWSLAVEEQFYLAWPILLWAAYRLPLRTPRRRLVVGIAGVGILSFVGCLLLARSHAHWAFFASPPRAWEFALGGLLTQVERTHWSGWRLSRWFPDIGLVALAAAFVTFTGTTRHPGYLTWLPVLATGLILVDAESSHTSPARWLLATRPAERIGDVSYSWYLWHWPLLIFARQVFELDVAPALIAVALSWCIAVLSYERIERPLRGHPALARTPVRSLLTLGAATAIVCLSVSTLRITAAAEASSDIQARLQRARSDRPRLYAEDCHADHDEVQARPCTYGSATGDLVVLFGDSHAAQWFPALEALAEARQWRLAVVTKSACPPAIYEPFNDNLRRRYWECTTWRDAALQWIAQARPRLTVVSSSRRYLEAREAEASSWADGERRLLERLAVASDEVVVLRDTPWPKMDLPLCLARAAWRGRDDRACDFDRSQDHSGGMWSSTVPHAGNVAAVDVSTVVCPQQLCEASQGSLVTYSDEHHLTASYARTLSAGLARVIDAAGRDPASGIAVRLPRPLGGDSPMAQTLQRQAFARRALFRSAAGPIASPR